LTGNSGTTPLWGGTGTAYIGTADAKGVSIATAGVPRAYFDSSGNFQIPLSGSSTFSVGATGTGNISFQTMGSGVFSVGAGGAVNINTSADAGKSGNTNIGIASKTVKMAGTINLDSLTAPASGKTFPLKINSSKNVSAAQISLTASSAEVTGVLPVANGGTGQSTDAAGGILGYSGSTYPNPTGLAPNEYNEIPIKSVGSDIYINIDPAVGSASNNLLLFGAGNSEFTVGGVRVQGGNSFGGNTNPGGSVFLIGGTGNESGGLGSGGLAEVRGGTGLFGGEAILKGGYGSAGAGGNVKIIGGYAAANYDGGNVYVDGGNSQNAGSDGVVYVGTQALTDASTSAVVIGRTGITTTINGTLSISGAIQATSGGTGFTSYSVGDLLYAGATNGLTKLAIGTPGEFLKVASNGTPEWSSAGGGGTGTVTSIGIATSDTGLLVNGLTTDSTTTSKTFTLAGTLAAKNGGTGFNATTITSNAGKYLTATAIGTYEFTQPSSGGSYNIPAEYPGTPLDGTVIMRYISGEPFQLNQSKTRASCVTWPTGTQVVLQISIDGSDLANGTITYGTTGNTVTIGSFTNVNIQAGNIIAVRVTNADSNLTFSTPFFTIGGTI
jgi:hypothetical protein